MTDAKAGPMPELVWQGQVCSVPVALTMQHVTALVIFAMMVCGHLDLLHGNDAVAIVVQTAHLAILVAG